MARLLLVVAVLLFSGCGGRDGHETLQIAMVAANATDPFFKTLRCGAEREADRLGVELRWSAAATFDISAQAANVQTALLHEPDGLVIVPASETTFLAQIRRLMRQGTPVNIVTAPMQSAVHYQRFATDTDGARYDGLARRIAQRTGGSGRIAILGGIAGTELAEPRFAGLVAALHAEAPGIEVLPVEYPALDRIKAAAATSALILRYPDLKAVYATSGPEGTAAAQAVREARATGRVHVYAYDAMPEQVAALRRGEIDALLAQSPESMGRLAVRSLVTYLRAHPDRDPVEPADPHSVHTPRMLLTRENVDAAEATGFRYRTTCDRSVVNLPTTR